MSNILKKFMLLVVVLANITIASGQENYCKDILQEEIQEPENISEQAEYNDYMEALSIEYQECVKRYYKDLEYSVKNARDRDESLKNFEVMVKKITESLDLQGSVQIYELEDVEETIGYQEINDIMENEIQDTIDIIEEEKMAQREIIEIEEEESYFNKKGYEYELKEITPIKPTEVNGGEYVRYYEPGHPYSDEQGYTYYSKNEEYELKEITPIRPSEVSGGEYVRYYEPDHPYSDEQGYTYYSKND